MTRKKVTPLDGKSIPMADGNGDLPKEGRTLTLNSYWHRREADRDVAFSDPDDEVVPNSATPPGADDTSTGTGTSTRAKK